jgi:hypothetical protein
MMNGAMMPNNCSTGQEVRTALKASKAIARLISPPQGNRLEGCSWRGDDAVVVDEAAVEACEAKQAMKSTVVHGVS